MGVKEKVFVQMGQAYFNEPVNIFLEHPTKPNTLFSESKTVECKKDEEIRTVELMV